MDINHDLGYVSSSFLRSVLNDPNAALITLSRARHGRLARSCDYLIMDKQYGGGGGGGGGGGLHSLNS